MRLGERVMVRSEAQLATVAEVAARMLKEHGPVLVTVEKLSRRSNDQNSLMWSIVSQIADAAGVDKNDLHAHLLVIRYGWQQTEWAGQVIQRRPKSSKFSAEQMSDFIHWLLEFAADKGIKITTPDVWGGEY